MTDKGNIIESRYKALLDCDSYIVIATPDRVLKLVNNAYCSEMQRSAESLIGTKFTDSFSDDALKFYTGFIKNLTPVNPVINTIQMTGSGGNGKWISWKETGIFDESGSLMEIVFTGKNVNRDIESKQGKLLSTLTAFKQAIDTNVICTITDAKGFIIYANELFCNISKYSQEELLGKTHRIVNSQFHSREFFNEMWSTISAGHMWTGDIRNQAKDGAYYWVKSVIVPIKDQANTINSYLSLRILITDRKEMEAKRAEYLKAVEDMLHMVSHEIRKPLTTCQGLLYLMQEHMPQTSNEYFESIEHLIASASELDDYSRKLNDYLHSNMDITRQ